MERSDRFYYCKCGEIPAFCVCPEEDDIDDNCDGE